jgi:hypothetical protein
MPAVVCAKLRSPRKAGYRQTSGTPPPDLSVPAAPTADRAAARTCTGGEAGDEAAAVTGVPLPFGRVRPGPPTVGRTAVHAHAPHGLGWAPHARPRSRVGSLPTADRIGWRACAAVRGGPGRPALTGAVERCNGCALALRCAFVGCIDRPLVNRRWSVASCMLHVASCTLHLASCMWHLAPCILHVASCTLYLARCNLHVASCTLHVACTRSTDRPSVPCRFSPPRRATSPSMRAPTCARRRHTPRARYGPVGCRKSCVFRSAGADSWPCRSRTGSTPLRSARRRRIRRRSASGFPRRGWPTEAGG